MGGTQTLSISQLRQKTAQVIKSATDEQTPTIILQRSKPMAILVDLNYFQALEEAVFDLTDSQEAERARKEKKESLTRYLKRRWGTANL